MRVLCAMLTVGLTTMSTPLTFSDLLWQRQHEKMPAHFFTVIGRNCTITDKSEQTLVWDWNELGQAVGSYEILKKECKETVVELVVPNAEDESPDVYRLYSHQRSDAVDVEEVYGI